MVTSKRGNQQRGFTGSVLAVLVAAGGLGLGCSSADGPSAQPRGVSGSGAAASAGAGVSGGGSGTSGSEGGMAATAGSSGFGGSAGSPGKPGIGLDGIVPLFDDTTKLEPVVVEDTPTALITRLADRARDRHARESEFQAYEHYLHIYWEHRTAEIEIVDTVGKGGDSIQFNVTTQWKLDDKQAELRFFFRGIGTVAEYHDNGSMDPVGDELHYTRSVSRNAAENRPLQVGDKLEFECSQFLDAPPRGRDNYYGTTFLYIVGKGIVPWAGTGELRDSEPIPESAWLGGHTTVHRNESDEPDNHFMQMAANLAPQNGQRFVLGRRAAHTHFGNGSHDESAENPVWQEQVGKQGPFSINHSCNSCHFQNGRAVPPATGEPLDKFVFKVGDAEGKPDPLLGGVLQPTGGEGNVSIASWVEEAGLQKPVFAFAGATPTNFSPRVAPQLVGMGLLEAITEQDILALADPDDADSDGISGRPRVLIDPVTGDKRLGRFGWRAGQAMVKYQVAGALRTDMGVTTSVFPTPDCGASQQGCGDDGPELEDTDLDNLSLYISLLGIRPQRAWDNAEVLKGQQLFTSVGCANCHTETFETSAFHPFAELRSQTIHPYTDLLLHDMGPGLADTLPEGDASYLEWRTPPLWGVGLSAGLPQGEGYLHDGRARTLSEAVLWHGGEAAASQQAFSSLSAPDKQALLAFLGSL